MAEKLYFIKTNPVVAKINLYNRLCREETQVLPFLKDDKKTSLELIKKKALDHIDHLSKEELQDLFRWFDATCGTDPEKLKSLVFTHGIDIFHEIPDSLDVQAFHQILSGYEKHFRISLGYKAEAGAFNRFLIYGIFFSGLANEDSRANFHFDYLKSGNKDLYTIAEAAVHEKKSGEFPAAEIHHHFSILYDDTKFYKGNILMLSHL
ncbi:hypothetical protein [Chryseobacterium hagamense]|uniref:Uncharacterized protein n=1 Tax=Chryseobacterium hagamense TaxID=395935 RepID=A0A511YM10_9FLAO|nr:hypothetical protein [Chryseobacterium hagamense]GEN76227.1 hypothetical protein CHA01nite_19670 [Chryseobacterium hagamense]